LRLVLVPAVFDPLLDEREVELGNGELRLERGEPDLRLCNVGWSGRSDLRPGPQALDVFRRERNGSPEHGDPHFCLDGQQSKFSLRRLDTFAEELPAKLELLARGRDSGFYFGEPDLDGLELLRWHHAISDAHIRVPESRLFELEPALQAAHRDSDPLADVVF